MKNITIYASPVCPYCKKAKGILDDKNISYKEIRVDLGSREMGELTQRTGFPTLPQIFIEDKLIGGCSDLETLVDSGKFEEMIK